MNSEHCTCGFVLITRTKNFKGKVPNSPPSMTMWYISTKCLYNMYICTQCYQMVTNCDLNVQRYTVDNENSRLGIRISVWLSFVVSSRITIDIRSLHCLKPFGIPKHPLTHEHRSNNAIYMIISQLQSSTTVQ